MILSEALGSFRSVLDGLERVLITTHVNPDGDAVGSVLALRGILRSLGKQAEIVLDDEIPVKYRFLIDDPVYRVDDREFLDMVTDGGFEMAVYVDASEPERAGAVSQHLDEWMVDGAPVANIDHHISNTGFGDIVIVDGERASAAELVLDLSQFLGIELTPPVANQLFAAVLTDTGRFQFSNTSPESLQAAGSLVAAGAVPSLVTERIYFQRPAAFYQLLGSIFSDLEMHYDGRLCVMTMSIDQARQFFPTESVDTEGIVDFTVQIDGTDLGAFVRQMETGVYRVSLRSRGDVDVRAIAEAFGGGGHAKAAGCRIEGKVDEVKERVVAEIGRHLG